MRLRIWLVVAVLGLIAGCFDEGSQRAERDSGSSHADAEVRDAAEQDADDTWVAQEAGDSDVDEGCADGLVDCGGECVETQSNATHCGACDVVCEPEGVHSVAVCESGTCTQQCEAGWSDLDGDAATGCELECEPTNGGDEICDGNDNDCNGVVDDGFSTGACTVGTGACEASGQYVCVDDDTAECSVTPGAPTDEVCADGVDNDCDGAVDEDDAVDASSWFADGDGDGFGDAAVSVTACERPDGYVDNDTDCDDTDQGAHTEVDGFADQDGDGYTDGGLQTLCTDGTLPSGYVASKNGQDCDDTSIDINPSADEVCGDGIDNDCDGDIDDASAVDAREWYIDCDGDGFSATTAGSRTSCDVPSVAPGGCNATTASWTDKRPDGGTLEDCNDEVAEMHPGQTQWFDEPIVQYGYQTHHWDYNCDGSMEHRVTNTDASCQPSMSGLFCVGDSGWVDSNVMACGSQNDYQNCKSITDCSSPPCNYSCDASVVVKTQECQ
jgi:hypothetical protein